jgi:hypothetical protein
MFSDRFWILKLAVAGGLLALLSLHARKALGEREPEIERVALFSDQLRDRTLYVSHNTVTALDATGVQIDTRVGPMHLRTTERPAVGSIISALVRPVGPREMDVIRFKVNEGFRWKRALNYGVSILTVVAYLWLIRRRFRWNPDAGVFRSRY